MDWLKPTLYNNARRAQARDTHTLDWRVHRKVRARWRRYRLGICRPSGLQMQQILGHRGLGQPLHFLRALRASLHTRFTQEDKLISLAVRVQPFDNADGPMEDVSPFAEYVDFASIMAFDINGVWSNTTGPNAPLESQRGRGAPYSLSQSVDQWLAAKWPAEKLIAGVSFLGRSLTTRNIITAKQDANMFVPFDRDIPQGDAEDARWYDVCENVNTMSGIWQ
ncbi:glycoside hydrolase superfamily [Kickxella alabastrina]|uniref:glycoside hydrolase superfamily n=1 Tax=Kickxella alabastrina TaxID=61397 RepID=UPI00221FE5BB|nr:glycoside hydrolase superfamily [Kickxella alabastrina]KAI7826247.1 glycoside hydrolase superfamily [Kickxella alabastrina]